MELYLKPQIKPAPTNRFKHYTPDEIKAIALVYPYLSNTDIALRFKRTEPSILNLARKHGWFKSPEYMDKRPGCFSKNHSPWNKGMKGLQIGGRQTQFKKHHVPANLKPEGYISIRYHKRDGHTYKYIKTKSEMVLLHRYNYMQVYGYIPKGHVVTFIDGNSMNCDVSNLKLISRADNARRNINRKKAALRMKEIWRVEKLRHTYGMKAVTGFGMILQRAY